MGEPCACITAGSQSNPERLIINSCMMFSNGGICLSLFVLRLVERKGKVNVPACLLRLDVGFPPVRAEVGHSSASHEPRFF